MGGIKIYNRDNENSKGVVQMKLTFIGADHEVTGSCHCLEVGGKYILVDYGMEQGVNVFENAKLPVEEARVDYVLLTHAHVDHSGMLPLLYARGFRGQVFTTEASADLCDIMLRDCAHIQAMEAEWKNRKAKRSASAVKIEPEYTMEDAEGLIRRIASAYGLNDYAASIITGIILFCILGSEFFINYRMIFRSKKEVK